MKRLLKKLLLFILLALQAGQNIPQAAFDDFGTGARAPGMANVYIATADDADSLYYNPAGLPYLKEGQLSTQYADILKGASDGSSNTDTYLGYAQPLINSKTAIGFGYRMFSASNLFKERTIILSYGRMLEEALFGWNGLWSFGFNIKQLHRQFQPDRFTENALNDAHVGSGESDPLFAKNGYTKDAYSTDGGLLYRFGPANRYAAAMSMMNINQPDLSLGGDGDKAPLITKLGFTARPRWGLASLELRRVTRLENQADTDIAFGAERRFILSQSDSAFSFRGGYAQGSREYKELTSGFSYEFGRARLDYAFGFPFGTTAGTGGTHRFGLAFKFITPKEISEKENPEFVTPKNFAIPNALPEAPAALVAPEPFGEKRKDPAEFDERVRNFGVLLGNYFVRRQQGAGVYEREVLLNQIKIIYGNRGIDLTLVENELKQIAAEQADTAPTPVINVTPQPTPISAVKEEVNPAVKPVTPKPTPVQSAPEIVAPKKAKPAPSPESKPVKKVSVVKPKHFDSMSSLSQLAATSTELDQALKYYKMAVDRGISDSERIEVLEAILFRFGESGAAKINSELERLRRRTNRAPSGK